MKYMNMDRKLLRIGGRKAPKISENDLNKLIDAWLPDYQRRMNNLSCMTAGWGDDAVVKDLDKIHADLEEFKFYGIRTGSNGITYMWLSFHGDEQLPVYAMLYWDGKNIRAYIPGYGNTVNIRDRAAIDLYGPDTPIDIVYEEGGKQKIKHISAESCEFYDWATDVEVNETACAEAFSLRVKCVGSMSSAEVDKMCDALREQAKKNEEAEEAWDEECKKASAARIADESSVSSVTYQVDGKDITTNCSKRQKEFLAGALRIYNMAKEQVKLGDFVSCKDHIGVARKYLESDYKGYATIASGPTDEPTELLEVIKELEETIKKSPLSSWDIPKFLDDDPAMERVQVAEAILRDLQLKSGALSFDEARQMAAVVRFKMDEVLEFFVIRSMLGSKPFKDGTEPKIILEDYEPDEMPD